MTEQPPQTIQQIMDGSAVAAALGTFFGLLPNVAALLSILWLAIRIYESDTVQALILKWKTRPK